MNRLPSGMTEDSSYEDVNLLIVIIFDHILSFDIIIPISVIVLNRMKSFKVRRTS